MSAIITNKFRLTQAASFISSFATNNIYIAIGKSSVWTAGDGGGVSESVPATPSDSFSQDTKDFSQILGMKLVPSSGASYVIPRVDWTTGTVYTMYDDTDALLNTAGHYCYVLNPNNLAVYKCLWNNAGATSTVIPSSVGTSIFTTADNYQWKYMYSLLPADASTFLNTAWIPVRDKGNATLSTDQAAVQAAAINGGIHVLKIVNGGSGYTNGTFSVTGTNAVGDGTGFVGSITVIGGVITSSSVSSTGTGYSLCTITIPAGAGAGTSGSLRAVISPLGGHGSDPVSELSAFYVMATSTLNYAESGELTTSNDYRKIFLLQNPLLANGSSQSIPGASVKTNTTRVIYTGSASGTFQLDEVVNFGSSASQGILVDHDVPGKTLYFTELSGAAIPASATATGTTSGATVAYTTVTAPFFKPKTGYLVYKDYRKAIMRSFDQTETLSTIVQF
jgi:hypothetical protein